MEPKQAIEIAARDGFCRIGQHTYLWKTCEAAAHIKLADVNAPFLLVLAKDWADVYAVKNASDKLLIKAIGERK